MHSQNPLPSSHGSGQEPADSAWICVATAPNQLLAEMWQQLLLEASIPSMLAPQDTNSFLGVTPAPVRLMVPLETLPRAEEILTGLAPDDARAEPEEAL